MDDTATFKDVVGSKEFRQLAQTAFNRPLRYDEFCKLDMPRGCEPREVWECLMLMQHSAGRSLPIKPWFKGLDADECWFYLPKSVNADLFEIVSLIGSESRLNRFITENLSDQRDLLRFVWEEVTVLAQADGIPISARQVEELWTQSRTPHSPEEQVIFNFSQAFDRMHRFTAARPYSRILVQDIQDLLLSGIENLDLHPAYHWDEDLCIMERLNSSDYAAECLDSLQDITANTASYQDATLNMMIAAATLCDIAYVKNLRCLTEYLLRRVYLIRNDVEVLSYVPLMTNSQLRMASYNKTHETESLSCPKEGLCATWVYSGLVHGCLIALKELDETVSFLAKKNRERTSNISRMDGLSQRQRSFLIAASRNPEHGFKIRQYETAFNVAYSTARDDLMDLVNKGLLSMQKKGRAFVFFLTENLKRR